MCSVNWLRYLVVLSVVAGGMSGPLRAQEKLQYLMPDGTAAPTTLKLIGEGQPWKVWVACEGYVPRYRLDRPQPVIGKSASFMEPFLVVEDYQTEDAASPRWLLLANTTDGTRVSEYFGWVEAEVVVWQRHPLVDEGTALYRKLRVVNTRESIAKALKEAQPELADVGVTHRPEQGAEVKHRFKLAKLFFVYAETKDFVLVGSAPSFQASDPAGVVKGWIPSNRASRWNTRLGFEWDWESTDAKLDKSKRRTEAGRVFAVYNEDEREEAGAGASLTGKGTRRESSLDGDATIDAATRYLTKELDGEEVENATGFIEKFDPRGESVPFEHDEPRMPILARPIPSVDPPNNDLFKVGWVGGYFGDDIDIGKVKQALEAAQEGARKLDLLIVVDMTGSMQEYFRAVSSAVARIFLDVHRQAQGDPRDVEAERNPRDVRVSVCYYGDEGEKGDEAFEVNPFRRLTPPEGQQSQQIVSYVREYLQFQERTQVGNARDYFSKHPPSFPDRGTIVQFVRDVHEHKRQGGRGARESVFKGIRAAIAGSGFRPEAQKLAIVIGDKGDLSGEGDFAHREAREKRDEVVAALFPAGRLPIGLCVIHTESRGPGGADRHPDAVLFETQMKSIAQWANERSLREDPPREGEAPEKLATYVNSSELGKVRGEIEQRYQSLRERSESMEKELERKREGEWNSVVARSVRREVRRQLEYEGVDLDMLEKAQGSQIYEEGYVWRGARQPREVSQVRTRVLLNAGEISDIVGFLERLVGPQVGRVGPREATITELALAELERVAGEKGAYRTLEERYFSRLRIPVTNEIMKMTAQELRECVASDEVTRELALKWRRLSDIISEDKMAHDWDWAFEDVDGTNVNEWVLDFTKEEKEDRSFRITGDRGGTDWYWVILESELP